MIQMQRATEIEANVKLKNLHVTFVNWDWRWPDEEYHDTTSKQSNKWRRPMEISKIWPEVWSRREVEAEAGDVDRTVRQEVEHGGQLGDLIQTAWDNN